MSKIKFGTDGWRAVISDDFTFENVKIVAQAMADYVRSQKSEDRRQKAEGRRQKTEGRRQKSALYGRKFEIVIGYDTRFMSEKYAELIACVLAGNGIRAILASRPTPTPSVSFNIKKRRLLGGIMVTASHNPAYYNGIKYKGHFGGSAGKEITDKMEARLYKSRVRFMEKKEAIKKKLLLVEDIIPIHLKHIFKYADMRILKKAHLNVLVDSMNGTGAFFIEELLRGTNNKVTTINGSRDPYFGGNSPEPNEVHLASTGKMIKKGNFTIGLATDGDADRLGVILPNGKVISGHKVMTLLFLHLLEGRRMKGGVVQTICGTALIDKIARAYAIKTYETAVGFKYIAEIMNKKDILVGGEETGGVALKGWLPERDGLLSGLLILEMIACRKKSLEKILQTIDKKYGSYVYKRYDLKLSVNKKKLLMAFLKQGTIKEALGKKIVNTKSYDGFKFIRQDGSWFMLRPSGTEPKLRIYSEGKSEKEAEALIAFGRKIAGKI